jgi:hypothetical protein
MMCKKALRAKEGQKPAHDCQVFRGVASPISNADDIFWAFRGRASAMPVADIISKAFSSACHVAQ